MAPAVLGALVLGLVSASVACNGGAQWQPAACPACPGAEPKKDNPAGPATPDEVTAFLKDVDENLRRLWVKRERSSWVRANFITSDTEEIAAEADQETMEYLAAAIKRATRFDAIRAELPADQRRQLGLLKIAGTLPAPNDSARTAELATLMSSMQGRYGKGKYCPTKDGALRKALSKGDAAKDEKIQAALGCSEYGQAGSGLALGQLSQFMAKSRDEPALREVWIGWRKISPAMRKEYERYVALGNEGASAIGFNDVGELWRAGYDMPTEAFRAETERLWGQLKPFYDELHCYARKQLQKQYGKDLVADNKPIPAHLFGNMWSQTWGNLWDIVEPYKGVGSLDVDKALVAQGYDEVKMVKTAENFFTSLGLDPLPATFWERSLFKKPADREVECHASAWDVHFNDDLRIKMCIQITEEELGVVHHELGHNYYFHYYYQLPMLFQNGANDGFHEAIGDAIALSITPAYLKRLGLIADVQTNDKADINYLLKMALDKVSFLPFGKLIDQWRWDVFAGKIPSDKYNEGWWNLRTKYQGIAPPEKRSEADFDPGAKYHVPGSVPYTRYFLAFIYQFQFQRALCRAAGHSGPLHTCSIYGNKAAGEKLKALLQLGASKSWQEALAAMSGESAADAGALLEYFSPLRGWLKNEIQGETCGW